MRYLPILAAGVVGKQGRLDNSNIVTGIQVNVVVLNFGDERNQVCNGIAAMPHGVRNELSVLEML